MRPRNHEHDTYSPEFLAMMQSIWGNGFLSPGGEEAVDAIVSGIEIAGKTVLDIGAALGGPSFVLSEKYCAARVIGIDVQAPLVEQARRTANRLGIDGKVEFIATEQGPLPFDDSSFDVVFSKDSIIHVADKSALIREMRRVLKSGGIVAMSDWFGGNAPLSPEAKDWLEASGLTFALKPIEETAKLFEEAEFINIFTEDRNAWYAEIARRDVVSLEGEVGQRLVAEIGDECAQVWYRKSVRRELIARQGHLRPGNIWAQKPAQ